MARTEKIKNRLLHEISTLGNKGNDYAFHEKIRNEGYEIALKFYEAVKEDIEEYRSIVGTVDEGYLEISEAIAYLGSGILRGATAGTRVLINAGDFRQNKHLVESEKRKVGKCYHLIQKFAELDMQDSGVIATVNEVRDIIYDLHTKLN